MHQGQPDKKLNSRSVTDSFIVKMNTGNILPTGLLAPDTQGVSEKQLHQSLSQNSRYDGDKLQYWNSLSLLKLIRLLYKQFDNG